MATRARLTSAYRWQVASRCVAAVIGGLALTSAFSIALAWALARTGATSRYDAMAIATLASFALWAAVILWAFHTASLRRVWLNMVLPALVLAALAWWLARAHNGT